MLCLRRYLSIPMGCMRGGQRAQSYFRGFPNENRDYLREWLQLLYFSCTRSRFLEKRDHFSRMEDPAGFLLQRASGFLLRRLLWCHGRASGNPECQGIRQNGTAAPRRNGPWCHSAEVLPFPFSFSHQTVNGYRKRKTLYGFDGGRRRDRTILRGKVLERSSLLAQKRLNSEKFVC